jgi:GNAT superfamily N-acetyltransferase
MPLFDGVVRLSEPGDFPFMREMLYEAVMDDDVGPALSLDAVLADPKAAVYLDGWGRDGDLGVVAVQESRSVGAAWSRLYPAEAHGWGFIDTTIPEISIGVVENARGKGVGRALMKDLIRRAAQAGFDGLSLSMDPADPAAARLYESCGFQAVETNEDLVVMKLNLQTKG